MESKSSFGKVVFSATETIAGGIETIINAPEEVIADAFETLGNVIEDALDWLAKKVHEMSAVGKIATIILNWLGSFISGAMDLAGAVTKGIFAIISGTVCGCIRLLCGLISINKSLMIKGLFQIASGITSAAIITLGKLILLMQSVLFIQEKERKLTPSEREILKMVFKNSLGTYNIRLIPGKAGVFDVNNRPFTLGNTIYIRNRNTVNEPDLLVHECTHVWQYQNLGTRYISEALGAQWLLKDAYDWEAEIHRGNTDWINFNRESQAEFLEDVYDYAESIDGVKVTRGNGAFYNTDDNGVGKFVYRHIDQTNRANMARDNVRQSKSFRLSRLIFT